MKDTTWYRLLRLILGVGVFVTLLGGIVAVEGTAAVAEDLNEPMSTADMFQFMVGIVIGAIWDMVIAAGLASYIVWGDWRVGIINPPLFNTPEPRSIFQ